MTKTQALIRQKIEAAVNSAQCHVIEYQSEWLGYLPFGVYHWVECAGKEISHNFPSGWTELDLLALEATGFLEKMEECENPADEFERLRRYRVRALNQGL